MSKGYSSAMALIEAGKQMALSRLEKPMRTERDKKEKPLNLVALLDEKRREYEALKTFVEQQNKLNKPEEKKDEKKWKLEHIAMFLIATSPITGPLYVWWFRQLLGT